MADVVVCDAVLGNVVIKFFEGLSGYIFDLFRTEFRGSLRGRLAYLLLKPGVARIRGAFDYERAGGSPLLGVRGTVIITHGRARRRMVGYGVGGRGDDGPDARAGADRRGASRPSAGAATDGRGGRLVDADADDPPTAGAALGVRLVSGPELTVGRGVITEMVRLAAFEVPGVSRVGRGGRPGGRSSPVPAVSAASRTTASAIRVWIVARPGHALVPLTAPGPLGGRRRPSSGSSACGSSR